MSEWGNPSGTGNRFPSSTDECIVRVKRTQGTETSYYLQEKKSTETPLVAASESGPAQTKLRLGVAGVTSTKERPTEQSGKSDHRR
jgi:hypothetical protein